MKVLKDSLMDISNYINEIQALRTRKEYCKSKLIERGGKTEWRNSKYCMPSVL